MAPAPALYGSKVREEYADQKLGKEYANQKFGEYADQKFLEYAGQKVWEIIASFETG
jgi:hypothetical protein